MKPAVFKLTRSRRYSGSVSMSTGLQKIAAGEENQVELRTRARGQLYDLDFRTYFRCSMSRQGTGTSSRCLTSALHLTCMRRVQHITVSMIRISWCGSNYPADDSGTCAVLSPPSGALPERPTRLTALRAALERAFRSRWLTTSPQHTVGNQTVYANRESSAGSFTTRLQIIAPCHYCLHTTLRSSPTGNYTVTGTSTDSQAIPHCRLR